MKRKKRQRRSWRDKRITLRRQKRSVWIDEFPTWSADERLFLAVAISTKPLQVPGLTEQETNAAMSHLIAMGLYAVVRVDAESVPIDQPGDAESMDRALRLRRSVLLVPLSEDENEPVFPLVWLTPEALGLAALAVDSN